MEHNQNSDTVYDVIVVGGGPGGLSAAVYTSRADLRTLVLDKNPLSGALGIASKIENYPGIPHTISGSDLLTLFQKQAEHFGARMRRTQVVGVDFQRDVKEILTLDGTFKSKTVIIATGAMGRTPSIEGEARFLGRGVSYCVVCDAAFFRDKSVAFVGERSDAIDEIAILAKFARKICIVTRNTALAGSLEKSDFPWREKVEVLQGYRLQQINGNTTVSGIRIVKGAQHERSIEVSGVFIYLSGTKPLVDFLSDSVAIRPEGCIEVNRDDMSTSVQGVYAIGDVTCNRFRQVIIAAAEGAVAALSADRFINGESKTHSW
jgi:thioredoxin reductase (NADPH)